MLQIFEQDVAGWFRSRDQKDIITHGSIVLSSQIFCTEIKNVSRTFNNKFSHVADGGIANFVVNGSNFVRSQGRFYLFYQNDCMTCENIFIYF